jgi:hypothetical protein
VSGLMKTLKVDATPLIVVFRFYRRNLVLDVLSSWQFSANPSIPAAIATTSHEFAIKWDRVQMLVRENWDDNPHLLFDASRRYLRSLAKLQGGVKL